ncbi:acyl carrier protein [Amycolatopsis lurida]
MALTAATREDVEQFIIELLAAEQGLDPTQLREELSARGADLPYDSVLLVELMTLVERRFNVRLRTDLPTTRDMRSIRSFAERVIDELAAGAGPGVDPGSPPGT